MKKTLKCIKRTLPEIARYEENQTTLVFTVNEIIKYDDGIQSFTVGALPGLRRILNSPS